MDTSWNQTASFIEGRISQLNQTSNEAAVRATFAKMRRGLGKSPAASPENWELTLQGVPEGLTGKGLEPSWGEWAIHISLTLYSFHQQGKSLQAESMHEKGQYLGKALQRLIKTDEESPRIKKRFDQLVTANNLEEIANYLRGIVQLLKAEEYPLDYSALGQDLYLWQNPATRDGVRLRWGRDYYHRISKSASDENKKQEMENL